MTTANEREEAKSNLLVVDDEDSLLQIFVEFLEGREFHLTIARSAEEAMERIAEQQYHLVITDLNLPGQDGLAVLRAAREKDRDTEVIVLTGNASTLTAIDAMRQGAYDYILKPFDLYEMERTIQKALERRRLLEENRRYLDSMRVANDALRTHQEELTRAVEVATRRITTLYEVGKEITSSLHLDRTLHLILDRSVGLTGAIRGMLFLLEEGTGQLSPRVSLGLAEESEEYSRLVTALEPYNTMGLGRKAPVREDAALAGLSVLVVPLLQEGEVTGTIAVLKENGTFSKDDGDLLVGLASFASIAIHNARVFGKIRDLDKLKSEFVAVVSHEVRTPLTAIKGTLEILSDEKYFKFPPNQMELLGICSANVSRLEVLINDILDFSKLESSRLSTHFTQTSIESLIENVVTNISGMAARKGIKVAPDVPEGLPTIEVDELRILQVLNNLVSNAIKFSPDQSVVRISASADGGGVIFWVRDSGIGISQEDLPKLFTKFRQLDSSTTRKAGGTGLGLVISKGIVEEHGGRIWVESTRGQGSTFAFYLPCKQVVRHEEFLESPEGQPAA